MFFHYIVYFSSFILCIQALPVQENPNAIKEFKGFKHLGSWKRNGPDGSIMESNYYISEGTASWELSSLYCQISIGGPVLSIEDEEEDNIIRDLLFEEGLTGGVWSSGWYNEEEGAWMWVYNNNPVTYSNFKQSPPPNNSSMYNILPNGTPGNYGWSTANRALAFKYICESQFIRSKN